MTSELIDAITIKLSEILPEAEIYVDEVKQGLVKPCFIVSVISKAKEYATLSSDKMVLNVNITYIGDSIYSVSDSLYAGLDSVTCVNGDIERAFNMSDTVVDDGFGDVLHFQCEFNIPVRNNSYDLHNNGDEYMLELREVMKDGRKIKDKK